MLHDEKNGISGIWGGVGGEILKEDAWLMAVDME